MMHLSYLFILIFMLFSISSVASDIGVRGYGTLTGTINMQSQNSIGWVMGPSFPISLVNSGCIESNGQVFVIGGLTSGFIKTSQIYSSTIQSDGTLGEWSTIGNYTVPIEGLATIKQDSTIYLLGGRGPSGERNIVSRSHINTDGTISPWNDETTYMKANRADMGVVIANGYIYAIGGIDNGSRLSSVEYAKINDDGSIGEWSYTSTLNYVRWRNTALYFNGFIYVIGGVNGSGGYVSQIERAVVNSDGTLGPWVVLSSSYSAAGAPQAVIKGNYLYVMGGLVQGTSMPVSTVLKTEILSDGSLGNWETVDGLNYGRYWSAALATDLAVYIFGGKIQGEVFSSTVECLVAESSNTTDNSRWVMSKSVNEARVTFPLVAHNNRIYALGGISANLSDRLSSIEVSDIQSDGSLGDWRNIGSLPSVLSDAGAIVIGNNVYVVGGQYGNFQDVYYVHRAEIKSDGTLGGWITESSLPNGLVDMGLTYANNYLFITGGASNGLFTNAVLRARVNSDGSLGTWESINSLNVIRWKNHAVAYQGYLYVVGGVAPGHVYQNTVERAKINSDGSIGSWQILEQTFPNAGGINIAMVGNRLYVVGGILPGSNNLGKVLSVEIDNNGNLGTWGYDTPMNLARQWMGVCENNGVLYSVGGVDPNWSVVNSTEYLVVSLSTSTTIENEAPAAPTGLGATAGNMQIVLSWDANSDSDLAGYNLYRRQNAGDYAKINSSLLTQTSYTDSGLTNGETYYYVVKAVDSEGLESEASNEVHAIPTGSWIQTAKEYWVPIYGWFNSMVCLSNVSNDTLDYVMTLYSNMGVQVSEISGKLNPHVSWSSLPELGNLYNLSNPVVCKVVASGEIRMATSLWGKSSDSVWEYDVDEVGQAGMYDYWILAAKCNQSIINVANPNDIEANITFKAYNNDGTVSKTKEITIPAHGMVADLEMRNTLTAQANAVRIQSDIPVVTSAGSFTSDGNNGQGLGVSPRSRNLKNR